MLIIIMFYVQNKSEYITKWALIYLLMWALMSMH